MGAPYKMKGSPMQRNFGINAESPVKQLGLAKKGVQLAIKLGTKAFKKAKTAYQKYKKGKPISTSREINPGGKVAKTTVEYRKTVDRTFFNADGTVNRTSSMPRN